jgi:hypothetical protein
VNRLDDLYSLLWVSCLLAWVRPNSCSGTSFDWNRGVITRSLEGAEYCCATGLTESFVTVPFLNQDPKALNVVQYILESCLLRREKTMRDKDGRLIVDLPPKNVNVTSLGSCSR